MTRPSARSPDELTGELTPEQRDAVRHGPGPLLLLAGPGAGKTRTLTHRVAHLLASGRAQPWEILAVTFSVRAAGELRLRLADLLGEERARGVTAATFHAVCARMLREHADAVRPHRRLHGLRPGRRPQGDRVAALRRPARRDPSGADRQRATGIRGAAGGDLAGQEPTALPRHLRAQLAPGGALVAAVWRELEVELRRSNAFDFDDLLVFAVRLLAEHPHRLTHYRQRWRWLLVDEFQDTNEAQSVLVALLAGAGGNVTVVADDDQLIYRWRGAEPRNMLGFGERYPGHTQIVLGRNFRCRAEILAAAVACVAHNQQRTGKALIAMRGPGGQVDARRLRDRPRRGAVGRRARSPTRSRPASRRREILVLARTGYATRTDPGRAGARPGSRTACSAASACTSAPRSATRSPTSRCWPTRPTRRRSGAPCRRRGAAIGLATASRVVALARDEHDGDLIAASAHAHGLAQIRSHAARERLARFGAELERVRSELRAGRSLGHVVVATLMLDGGLVAPLPAAPRPLRRSPTSAATPNACSRTCARCAAPPRPTRTSTATTASLTGFLEHAAGLHAAGARARSSEDRRITVSTIHRAKGTEAQQARRCSACEERLLPSWRALANPDPEQLAEERRLFYVAATRAKDRLALTHAATRGGRPTGGPSRFLTEAGLTDHPRRSPPDHPTRRSNPCPTTSPPPRPWPPARAHPRAGRRAAAPAVRARRDRLPRHEQGQPSTASPTPARRSPPSWTPSRSCSASTPSSPAAGASSSPRRAPPSSSPRRRPQAALPRLPADRHAAVEDPAAADVDAVYEDIGEMDAGSLAGLKALYSDARKRAAVAAGIGAYLYTALAPVVLPIGPDPRQVQASAARARATCSCSPRRPSSGCATATRAHEHRRRPPRPRRDPRPRRTRRRHGPGRDAPTRPRARADAEPSPDRRRPPPPATAHGDAGRRRLRRPRPAATRGRVMTPGTPRLAAQAAAAGYPIGHARADRPRRAARPPARRRSSTSC